MFLRLSDYMKMKGAQGIFDDFRFIAHRGIKKFRMRNNEIFAVVVVYNKSGDIRDMSMP